MAGGQGAGTQVPLGIDCMALLYRGGWASTKATDGQAIQAVAERQMNRSADETI